MATLARQARLFPRAEMPPATPKPLCHVCKKAHTRQMCDGCGRPVCREMLHCCFANAEGDFFCIHCWSA